MVLYVSVRWGNSEPLVVSLLYSFCAVEFFISDVWDSRGFTKAGCRFGFWLEELVWEA